MAEVIKIVISGAPGSGKTIASQYISEQLEKHNIKNVLLEDCAERTQNKDFLFYKNHFKEQLKNEKEKTEISASLSYDKVALIIDGGLLDDSAYLSREEFNTLLEECNINEDVLRNSYDAVFHLEMYNASSDEILKLDEDILTAWIGTPHLRVVKSEKNFENKLKNLMDEVLGFLGEPEPLEIERKFLIEYPDLDYINKLKTCRRVPMEQLYLTTPEEGNFRIRKRGEGDNAVYIKTVKIKISDIKRIEIENYISEEEYYNYRTQADCISGIISKDRYCIVYGGTYYELDIYPFWKDKATIEIELLNEEQQYVLPPFVKLIREVSFEPEYRNLVLAQKYGKSFDIRTNN